VTAASDSDHLVETEHRVSPLELFFDLVFVFALTQVTGLMSAEPTWAGLGKGLLVLGALWWAWVGYAWLTNTIDADEGGARLTVLAAMGAMLLAAIAAPDAFGDDALLFGISYVTVRVLHVLLYGLATDDADVRDSVRRFAWTAVGAPILIVVASGFDGWAQAAFWLVSLAIDYVGPALTGQEGWRVHAAHFAERHGLVIIIALGESIVAIGVSAGSLPLTAGIGAGALFGLTIAAALWWAYFDVVAIVAARKLGQLRGRAQNVMARDSFSYLHLPMVAGIVLLALGVKKTLAHVGDPLTTPIAFALCGGVALYLLGHIAFRLRNVGTWSVRRLVAAGICLTLVPVATELASLAALGGLAAVCVGLVAYEALRYRTARERVRHGVAAPAR